MIAGGFLENTRGNLAGWILNPQNLKPGTKMPPTLLEVEELHPLLDYLESLK
jgi:cytochrome c oxidase subunit 2